MVRGMIRVVVVVAALLVACSDDTVVGPFDDLRLDLDLTVGLTRPVHVARDKYGIAHINAQTVADAAFAQGYVMAHDRLPQMDILRRFGAGTLSELFGALDPEVIDTDLEMRMHRMKPLARETWARLQASDRPDDQEVVLLLQRFADGVNTYAASVRSETNPNGAWELDDNLLASFDASRFVAWDPVDSLVLGRFQAFALSWTTPFELDATELDQKLRATFEQATATDPALIARRGITRDLLKFTPVGQVPTIDGFPNLSVDTGTRSDAGRPTRRRPAPAAPAGAAQRPTVPQPVLDNARRFFARGIHTGAFGALGPHAFMQPYAGSNNWAVNGDRTGGPAILASDQHLQLPNPSIFYPTHLTIAPAADDPTGQLLDVIGVTFPGIPGVILGTNGDLAWSATVSYHDVNDVYLETITKCGDRSCVRFGGVDVPLETFTEEIRIGALGTITQTKQATYEVVPHHGPIIPTIDETRHELAERPPGTAISVRYTGYVPTYEIRALWNLGHAKNLEEGFSALHDFGYGSQNWTMIDREQDIGWTTHADVPIRQAAAYAWNADTNPTGLAPFFVLPGEGAEWTGMMSSRYVPHAINPAMPRDYLVSANADPVGATFDGDPLNQSDVDGNPLYVGVTYAAGVRHERIDEMIATLQEPITIDDMARMQHDTKSTMGTKLAPYLVAMLARGENPGGTPPDLFAYVNGLAAADRARLVRARTLLAGWTYATPTGLDTTNPNDLKDSAATAVFNAFMHFFVERTLRDELSAAGFELWRLDDNLIARIVHAMLASPGTLVQSATTQEPVVCDMMTTPGDDSCTKVVLQAMLDTMLHLESGAGFGTAEVAEWQWGKLHRLAIRPLFPNTELDLPAPGAPGFPKSGDNFVVNRSDQGWDDLDFSQSADGPAQRFLAIADGGQIRVKWSLPGGVIYDSRSPHYRDLLDTYYLPQTHFDAPFTVSDIVLAGESRWLFR
jgi:penicillin amidase